MRRTLSKLACFVSSHGMSPGKKTRAQHQHHQDQDVETKWHAYMVSQKRKIGRCDDDDINEYKWHECSFDNIWETIYWGKSEFWWLMISHGNGGPLSSIFVDMFFLMVLISQAWHPPKPGGRGRDPRCLFASCASRTGRTDATGASTGSTHWRQSEVGIVGYL